MDYTITSSTVTFETGSNISCFLVNALQDNKTELDEIFSIELSTAQDHVMATNTTQIRIIDDEGK